MGTMRMDVVRGIMLALLTVLIWCSIQNRWSGENWQIPLTYLSDPEKGDIIGMLAYVKAAGDGHILPLMLKNIPELGAPYVAALIAPK